jgi:hypothetical protein
LGSGVSGVAAAVFELAVDAAGHLFVGADFFLAGTNVSPYIAQANVGPGASGGQLGSPAYSPVAGFRFTFRDATPGQPYRIQSSPSLTADSWTDFTNFTYAGPLHLADTNSLAAPKRFYRAVTP